jgi:hypothetical protein
MAIGTYFGSMSMTTDQYDTCVRKLEEKGAGKPPGRIYHAAFINNGKVAVFDVWDSQQSFDRFGETLMPILKAAGVDPGVPHVMPIHNTIQG